MLTKLTSAAAAVILTLRQMIHHQRPHASLRGVGPSRPGGFALSSGRSDPLAHAEYLAGRWRRDPAPPSRPMGMREASQAFKQRLTGGRGNAVPQRPMTARQAAEALQQRMRKRLRHW